MKLQINGKEVEVDGKLKAQYEPRGELLALEPKAFGLFFSMSEPDEPELTDDGVAIIDIRGPLMHHRSFWFDSYDEIKARVSAAIALSPRFIILNIDSPGGLVSGAFDTARAIRQMTETAGVNTYAHITGVGASAAYALATAASWIGVSQTAMIGSIGVLDMLVDATAHNELHGINVKLIASGQRKTDGHPDEPMSEGAVRATQARVDELAAMFFALVEEHGFGKVDDLQAMQAAVFTGAQAVEVGLANEVITFDQTLAFAKPGAQMPNEGSAEESEKHMGTPFEDAIESLREAAQGDDEEEAKKAREALKAIDPDDPDAQGDDDDDESAQGDDDDDESAQGDDDDDESAQGDDDDDESAQGDDDKDAKAMKGSAKQVALRALAKVHNLEAQQKREKREAKQAKARADLIASRNDLSSEMVALLEDKSTPLKTVRKMVATLAKGKPRKTPRSMAAPDVVTGTQGANQGDTRTARLDPEASARLKAAFGNAPPEANIRHEPHRMIFGASIAPKKGK